MSAATSRLHLVGDAVDHRDPLLDLADGVPTYLPEPDMFAMFNSRQTTLERHIDPATYSLGQLALDWLQHHVAHVGDVKGDRTVSLVSEFRRYILPFIIETEAAFSTHQRGASEWRFQDGTRFAQMLAGRRDALLPAATVAGDLLGRTGLGSLWLTVIEAANVSVGGGQAVKAAIASGQIAVRRTAAGQKVVFAADLRSAGILTERRSHASAAERAEDLADDQPWGLSHSTSKRIIGDLKHVFHHAQDNGAVLRLAPDRIRAIKPREMDRMRVVTPDRFYEVAEAVRLCEHLSPVHQVALWLQRLAGLRVGEVFGLHLRDVVVRDGHTWLFVKTQGGTVSYVRNAFGLFVMATEKDHTKTEESTREIPLCGPLGSLLASFIRIFHTDPQTGHIDSDARLIPGLQVADTGGMEAYFSALKVAGKRTGIDVNRVASHDFRRSFITDLRRVAHIPDLIGEPYAGHKIGHNLGVTVHDGYDQGPSSEELILAADAVAGVLEREFGAIDLRIPTSKVAEFGRNHVIRERAADLSDSLWSCGWQVARGTVTSVPSDAPAVGELPPERVDTVLDVKGVAAALGIAEPTARRQMREGVIPAHQAPWESRLVWAAYASDVEAVRLSRESGVAIGELATEMGLTYHQAWVAVRETLEGERDRSAVRLSQSEADDVRAAVRARSEELQGRVTGRRAAEMLDLPTTSVQTLQRRGTLPKAASPRDTRAVYVPTQDVQRYPPASAAPATSNRTDRAVPVKAAQMALGITRPEMTDLVLGRHVRALEINRRQHVTLSSLLAYLDERPEFARATEALTSTDWPIVQEV